MSGQEVIALLGVAGTIIGIVIAIIGLYRATADKIQKGDDALHERVNRVRDEYVRRVDLDSHLQRLDQNLKELREENREGTRSMNGRLDTLLAAVVAGPKGGQG